MIKDVLEALNGNNSDHLAVIQKDSRPRVVKMRWIVFMHLHLLEYSNDHIANHFNMTPANVSHGIRRQFEILNGKDLSHITAELERRICKSIPIENKGLRMDAFKRYGYSMKVIAEYMGLKTGVARRKINIAVQKRDFENRMKSHVKFR